MSVGKSARPGKDKKDQEKIKAATFIQVSIQALESSAGRSRRIVVVLTTSCIIIFAAFWNSRQEGWFNQRLRVVREALQADAFEEPECLGDKRKEFADFDALHAYAIRLVPELTRERKEAIRAGKADPAPAGSTPPKAEADAEAQDKQNPASPEQRIEALRAEARTRLKDNLTILERVQRENITLVRVPLVGTVFDVNDLGIMSGLTFTFILITYWFSLTRERDTLKHVFAEAERRADLAIKDVYHLISSTQVLDVPSTHVRRTSGLQKYLTKFLALPPLLLQGAILLNDWKTSDLGRLYSQKQTGLSLILSGVFFFMILLLTAVCFRASMEITGEWDTRFEELEAERRELEAARKRAEALG